MSSNNLRKNGFHIVIFLLSLILFLQLAPGPVRVRAALDQPNPAHSQTITAVGNGPWLAALLTELGPGRGPSGALKLPAASGSPQAAVPVITSFSPAAAQVGMVVEILGGNLGTATQVTFGSTPARFQTISSAKIYTTVPPGAENGPISVTNASGTASSAASFSLVSSPPVLVGAGDIAECSNTRDEATAVLLDSIPGLVVTFGDNVYSDGTAAEFADCYDPTWGRHKARTRPAVGSHEYNTASASGYFNYFGPAAGQIGKGYYSYDIADWHIIVLNSECNDIDGCDLTSPQGQWLQADLAANSSACTLAYWHVPRFSSGDHGNVTNSQYFWQLLYDAGVDLILNGHDHNYERFAPQDPAANADPINGIREIVVGTGGKSLRPFVDIQPNSLVRNSDTYGVIKLNLYPTSYDWEFLPMAGQTFTDLGRASCLPGSNQPPAVAAGPDQTVPFSVAVSLSGLATDDGLPLSPGSITTTWGLVSGPGEVTFDDTAALNTSASFSAAGTYVLRLTASDGALMASDQITILVSSEAQLTTEVGPASGSDDAEESEAQNMYLTSSDLELVYDDYQGQGNQTVGIRFPGLAIPHGAAITRAYIQFTVDETTTADTFLTIEGEAADNAALFTTAQANLSSRARTTATVSWLPPPWTTAGQAGDGQQTPDLAAIVQEIVGRPGWTAGNALAIIITGTGTRIAAAYEGDPSAAALLHVEYVLSTQQPPVVNAGPDQTVIFPATVFLDGTVSDDGLPDPPSVLTTNWSRVGGPDGVTFDDPAAVDTTAAFSTTGTYILRLTASDGELAAADETAIMVKMPPGTLAVPDDYATIQAAINAAQDGDLVLVSPGTYNEQLSIVGKEITLASEYYTTGNPGLIDQTIIDGGGNSVITVGPTVGKKTQIIGFTIQNGDDGIWADAPIDILSNHIINTTDAIDYEGGGGICRDNIIENNRDDAVDLDGPTAALIENNILRNNGNDGIEIRLHEYSGPTLDIIVRGNLITGNAEDGIQLIDYPDLSDRIFYIERNLIQGNAMVGLGLMDNGDTDEDFRAASIPERIYVTNNTFAGNDYALTGGDNLIALNNLFVDSATLALKNVDGGSIAAYNLFWNNGTNNLGSVVDNPTTLLSNPLLDSDYRLLPGSPAIDTGTAFYEWQGETVLDMPASDYNGPAPDRGWLETTSEVSANFSASPITGTAPLTVTFTNESSGSFDTCGWSFGDGGISSSCDPVHTYASGGVYTVSLSVSDRSGSGGSDTLTHTNMITVYEPLRLNFSASPISGPAPLTVTFSNLSSGDFDACDWSFGDGAASGSCGNPSHTYTATGTYTVSLSASGSGGSDTLTHTNMITVYEPVLVGFSASLTRGIAPLTVTFSNLSSGDFDTCAWSFGDGAASSSCTNPDHTYTSGGVYTVGLAASGNGGNGSLIRPNLITVYGPVVVDFSGQPTHGFAPLTVTFSNLSSGDFDTCAWSFGDGAASSSCGNPGHTYSATGTYTVSLAASGNGGSDSRAHANLIHVSEPDNFRYLPMILK